MSNTEPLLTISLLSSGRVATIERCLSSLVPFKEQMDTEIIIVDTDPDHDKAVHAVLEKYADQIIPFKWCDDFSVARNIGLSAASGEWFLFVDDDEWFDDAQPIIDFLQSGEQKKYDRADYVLRNYKDASFATYGDAWINRLFRRYDDIRFVGKIHEYFQPLKGNAKVIEGVLAGHSGYIFRTEEEEKAHSERNMNLLKKMMEEEPNEVRWVMQVMMQYHDEDNYVEELALARKGYDMMGDVPGYRYACIRGMFAANILRLLRGEGKFEECYKEYSRIRRDKRQLGKVGIAKMEFEAAQAGYYSGHKKQVKKHCENFIRAYEKMHDAPTEWAEDYIFFLMDTFEPNTYPFMMTFLIATDIELGRWDSFEEYFDRLKFDGSAEYPAGLYEQRLLESMGKTDYNPRFAEMISVFWREGVSRKIVQERLLALTSEKGDPYWNLVRAIVEADTSASAKPLDIRIIWDDHEGIRENMPGYFRQLFSLTNPFFVDPMLWEIGLRRGAVLDERIAEVPAGKWNGWVDEYVAEAGDEQIRRMREIMDDIYIGTDDERHAYFRVKSQEKLAAQSRREAQDEMRQIIYTLQKKVDDLVSAGMIEEADKVLQEIQKYTVMIQ